MARGMILAAGRGTRLKPLTDFLPKPLLPVANLPVMSQGIRALSRLGITEIGVNVSYRGEQIREFFGTGHTLDVNLHWSIEEEPSGTAGGMKGLESVLGGEQVVVIAGDAMLDIDLAPLLEVHRAHGAFASLATVTVSDPSQYGVVVTDTAHRIIRFQEKPAPGTEISHQANTGIYIFEPGIFDLIPSEMFCDFALSVFPKILQRNLPFYAFPMNGYWTDIGNPAEYLQANLDYLADHIHVLGHGKQIGDNYVAPEANVEGAILTQCMVGARATIPSGSMLTQCVIWPDTVLAEPITCTNAVITPYGIFSIEGLHITSNMLTECLGLY